MLRRLPVAADDEIVVLAAPDPQGADDAVRISERESVAEQEGRRNARLQDICCYRPYQHPYRLPTNTCTTCLSPFRAG